MKIRQTIQSAAWITILAMLILALPAPAMADDTRRLIERLVERGVLSQCEF